LEWIVAKAREIVKKDRPVNQRISFSRLEGCASPWKQETRILFPVFVPAVYPFGEAICRNCRKEGEAEPP
jgi:hypothetical protein